ncbi:MAG: NfeD family protein [Verrucomicrobiota bacterium]
MNTILLLFLTGLLLLGVEVFVPGAILGLVGGALLVGGCVLAFSDFGFTGGAIAVAAALLLTGLLLWFEFKILPRTAMGRRLFLRTENGARSQPDVAESAAVVGRAAEALTALAPTGYVAVDGRRYEAFSRTGFVEQGAALTVVGVDTFRLIVQLSETNQPSSN